MKIFCPNCDATYETKVNHRNPIGQNFECSQCSQEWFQYNLCKRNKNDNQEEINLRKLANEEYQLSNNKPKATTNTGTEKDIPENVRLRVQESSDRFKKNRQHSLNHKTEIIKSAASTNQWTIIGFLTISLICSMVCILYVLNSQLQKNFPVGQSLFLKYKLIIDQVIIFIQNFYIHTLQIIN
ncbi:MAG: hypothetical protein P8M50_00300 [Paracoccaceae bacterium]|nr:hypothetical protein [Paracoccaceae bacterium]